MDGHKEKLMIMLLGKKRPALGNDDAAEEHDDLDKEGQHAAMSDFLDAVHRKDADAANEAMGQWMEHHNGMQPDEPDEEEPDEEGK